MEEERKVIREGSITITLTIYEDGIASIETTVENLTRLEVLAMLSRVIHEQNEKLQRNK